MSVARDLFIVAAEECDEYSGPVFEHGMRVRVEDIREEMRDVPVTFEDDDGRCFECVVTYDGDSVAWVDGWDERGNRAEFTDEQREAIVMIAAKETR